VFGKVTWPNEELFHKLAVILEDCARGLHKPGPVAGSTDNVWVHAMFGLGSNDSNETLYTTFQAFSGHSFFTRKRLFMVPVI
jgi:hypothetical protein